MTVRIAPLLALALALASPLAAGCGTDVAFEPANDARACAPHDPSRVDVYLHGPPSRAVTVMGTIVAAQSSYVSVDDRRAVFRELRQRAAELGCDGIVVAPDDGLAGDVTMNQARRYPFAERAAWRAACLVYERATPPSTATARR
ncbi:MAG TPA: hypothetical protein VGM56_32305 [Byssovorax sp.]